MQALSKINAMIMVLATLMLSNAKANGGNDHMPSPVFQKCATENNITLPAPGSGEKLAVQDKQALFACVQAAREAAFTECSAAAGVTEGQKPTPEQHKSIHSCMKAKGFGHHKHHKKGNSGGQSTAPSAAPAGT